MLLDMVTQQQLADMLREVSVAEVASMAGVSQKTVYRLRHMSHVPRLDVVARLVQAVETIRRSRRRPSKARASVAAPAVAHAPVVGSCVPADAPVTDPAITPAPVAQPRQG